MITEPKYGPEEWEVIYNPGPIIVTYISQSHIGFVAGGDGTEPLQRTYPRGRWDWDKHAIRIWPPVPSWEELAKTPALASDDLRAQVME